MIFSAIGYRLSALKPDTAPRHSPSIHSTNTSPEPRFDYTRYSALCWLPVIVFLQFKHISNSEILRESVREHA